MQRFRLSSCAIEFTSASEGAASSDHESDNQSEQRLNSQGEVIRVANLLDQVRCFSPPPPLRKTTRLTLQLPGTDHHH